MMKIDFLGILGKTSADTVVTPACSMCCSVSGGGTTKEVN